MSAGLMMGSESFFSLFIDLRSRDVMLSLFLGDLNLDSLVSRSTMNYLHSAVKRLGGGFQPFVGFLPLRKGVFLWSFE